MKYRTRGEWNEGIEEKLCVCGREWEEKWELKKCGKYQ